MKKVLLLGAALLGTVLTGCAVNNGCAAVRFGPPPPPPIRNGRLRSRTRFCLDRRLLGLAWRTLVLDGWPLDAPAARPRRLGARLLARRPPPVAIPARTLAVAPG